MVFEQLMYGSIGPPTSICMVLFQVDNDSFQVLLEYLQGLKGKARELTIEKAGKLLDGRLHITHLTSLILKFGLLARHTK